MNNNQQPNGYGYPQGGYQNPGYGYGPTPQPANFNVLLNSANKVAKAYIWLWVISILGTIIFTIAYVATLASAGSRYSSNYRSILNTAATLWIVLIIFLVLLFVGTAIVSILLIVKSSPLKDIDYNSFNNIFIFSIIGIFISIFSLIAAFMLLSKTKNVLRNQGPQNQSVPPYPSAPQQPY